MILIPLTTFSRSQGMYIYSKSINFSSVRVETSLYHTCSYLAHTLTFSRPYNFSMINEISFSLSMVCCIKISIGGFRLHIEVNKDFVAQV